MNRARCLCESVTWEADGPLELMHHCHCSRCRKTHGAAYATFVACPESGFRLQGSEQVRRWESTPGIVRCFCGRCGSVVPGPAFEDKIFMPAGNFDADPGVRPVGHIFTASKAPWVEITDQLPQFDAYPPGVDAAVLPDRALLDPPGRPRGSCLCGGITYIMEGAPIRARYCHCGRCRRARSAAFASNLITQADGLRFTRGADLVEAYKVPEAQRFTQAFCRVCGSAAPYIDRSRDWAIVPMGGFDDDPGTRPQSHIFVGSMAPWDVITDDLPQYAEFPPS